MVQEKSRTLPNYLMWTRNVLLCLLVELGCLVAIDTLHIDLNREQHAQLSEAELQTAKNFLGVNFTPEELTAIEVTPDLRDRLLKDPRAQSLLQSIHNDLMALSWGGGSSESPVWLQYGVKSFPLLDYYTQSTDPARQRYGMEGIFHLGKPYTTLWLKKQIKRRSPSRLLWNSDSDWVAKFGLDDPETRREILQLLRANLASTDWNEGTLDDPYYYQNPAGQFNRRLLEILLTPEEHQQEEEQETAAQQLKWQQEALKQRREHPEWQQKEAQDQRDLVQRKRWQDQWQPEKTDKKLTPHYIRQMLAAYRRLSAPNRYHILVEMPLRSSLKLSPKQVAIARSVAPNPDSRDWWRAIVVLTLHGDAEASSQLRVNLTGDLSQLLSPYRLGGVGDASVLVQIIKKYPDTRLSRSWEEYGDLAGHAYFHGDFWSVTLRDEKILRRNAQKTPAQRVADWQDWLNRYPDHPGADDATDHLVRSLLANGEVVEAAHQSIRLMTQPIGDGDARFRGYRRLRTLLDVGLSKKQIQQVLEFPESAAIAPLLRYALAVHFARDQNYARALSLSQGVDLTRISPLLLRNYSYFNHEPEENSYWTEPILTSQQAMQKMLKGQRDRWWQLQLWQRENTAASRYKIASDWASRSGWKNGYLGLWNGERWRKLPTWIDYFATQKQKWEDEIRWNSGYGCYDSWVCDISQRGATAIRAAYQKSSSNAIALALYQQLVDRPQTPLSIREQSLYREATTLAAQALYFHPGETQRIHPPAGVTASAIAKQRDCKYSCSLRYPILADYQRRIEGITAQLQKIAPKSRYTDDVLMVNYYLTWEPRYLEQVVKHYPQGDRAAEAQFLLSHPVPKESPSP